MPLRHLGKRTPRRRQHIGNDNGMKSKQQNRRRYRVAPQKHQIAEISIESKQPAAFLMRQRKNIRITDSGMKSRHSHDIVSVFYQPMDNRAGKILVCQQAHQ
jgi:hypothetical protein